MGERPPRPHHRTPCVKRMVIGGDATMLGQCWNEGQKNKVRVGIGSAWVGISGKFYSFGIPLLPQKHEIALLSFVVATDVKLQVAVSLAGIGSTNSTMSISIVQYLCSPFHHGCAWVAAVRFEHSPVLLSCFGRLACCEHFFIRPPTLHE
jgi:hypothetical protein